MLTRPMVLPLPPDLIERLEQAAAALRTTPASIVRIALNQWLARYAPPAHMPKG